MKRLLSTKSIFEGRMTTLTALLRKTESYVRKDLIYLHVVRGRLKRTSRQATLDKIAAELRDYSLSIGFAFPVKYTQPSLLKKVEELGRATSIMRYVSIHNALINLCVTYEDFLRRVILKYYEEDVRRLTSEKESLKNRDLVEALIRGDNIHRTLAEKVVDAPRGGVEEWYKALDEAGISVKPSRHVKELFLLRNCIVHNNRKVSKQLHNHNPQKYLLRSRLRLDFSDFVLFRDQVHQLTTAIIAEFTKQYPTPGTSWSAEFEESLLK